MIDALARRQRVCTSLFGLLVVLLKGDSLYRQGGSETSVQRDRNVVGLVRTRKALRKRLRELTAQLWHDAHRRFSATPKSDADRRMSPPAAD